MSRPDTATRLYRASLLRSVSVCMFAMLGTILCRGGFTASEFGTLLVVAGVLAPLVLLSDWIAMGEPSGGWSE